jgi:hypothetical protein
MLTLNVTNRIIMKITVWLIPTRQRFDNCLLKKFNYTYNHSLQPTILNDNVNQFKVGLESDKGYFTLKVKTMTLMSHFFCPQ